MYFSRHLLVSISVEVLRSNPILHYIDHLSHLLYIYLHALQYWSLFGLQFDNQFLNLVSNSPLLWPTTFSVTLFSTSSHGICHIHGVCLIDLIQLKLVLYLLYQTEPDLPHRSATRQSVPRVRVLPWDDGSTLKPIQFHVEMRYSCFCYPPEAYWILLATTPAKVFSKII